MQCIKFGQSSFERFLKIVLNNTGKFIGGNSIQGFGHKSGQTAENDNVKRNMIKISKLVLL